MARNQSGFTLIEALIVVALVAIMLAIGIPSFVSFMSRYRLTATSNDFLSGITLTRNEAIKRGRRVDMVPVSGNDWKTGWILFIDQNNNQLVDSGEEIINQHTAMPTLVNIAKATTSGNSCTTTTGIPFYSGGKTSIAYAGTGYSQTNTGGFLAGSMQFRDGTNTRCLIINSLGRPRITGS